MMSTRAPACPPARMHLASALLASMLLLPLAGSATVTSNWNAAGALAIGRGKNGGGLGDYVRGAVDSVQLYSGVMSDRQIADFSAGPNA